MRRISYHIEERDTGYAPIRRTEWPDRKGCSPINIQIKFTQPTKEEALQICANDADWQKIVAAEASTAIEIIHPKRDQGKGASPQGSVRFLEPDKAPPNAKE